jgi:hypothetical protein
MIHQSSPRKPANAINTMVLGLIIVKKTSRRSSKETIKRIFMRIVEIKEIIRKDVPIYYRRLYSSVLVIELMNKIIERKIDFSIETKPTGQKDVLVTIAEPVDYPLVPLLKELKKFINEIDSNGQLPPL